jgi:predicted nucleic acid-binding Zn ribbon protein
MRRKKGLSPAIGAVNALLQSHDLAQTLRPHMAKVCWAEVVGPQVAAVTQIERLQNGTELVVRVKNSVWANELVLLKGDMLRRLNQTLGGKVLTDIHFKAGGLLRDDKTAAQPDPAVPTAPLDEELVRIALSPEAHARIERTVAGIKQDEWRARIRRILTRAAQTELWKREHGWLPCVRCGTIAFPTPRRAVHLCPLCRVGIGG